MPLSEPRITFGVHSMTPYNRLTGEFFGILKIIGDTELSFGASFVDLFGGSNKFPWANETTQIDSQFTATVKSMPDFLFEKWIGGIISTTAASVTGTVGTITNFKGTSVFDATTGIDSVGATGSDEADLKFGRYVVKAITATTVDVFVDTDINFKTKGTNVNYENDLLKITAAPITIPDSGGTVTLGGDFGITLTGGSGTVSMTVDDTAYFEVVPAHGGISDIEIGQSTIQLPEFGVFIYAQERSSGELFRIHAYKAKSATGMVVPLAEGGFAIPNLTTKLLYDSAVDKVADIRAVAGQTA